MVHFRVGELDGVSLEMDKWYRVLEERFNHNVYYLAGSSGQSEGTIISELSLDYLPSINIRDKAFSHKIDPNAEKALRDEIRLITDRIKPKIHTFIEEFNITCFIINNIFSLPLNIPASLALFEVVRTKGISTMSHSHDFFWERSYYKPSCHLIRSYLDKIFPPNLPNIQHIVINSLAKNKLKKRRDIDSKVIPNVFYFEDSNWIKDSFNSDIRISLNIDDNDIIILQATRIIDRKGIELVIDLIHELNKIEYNRILLNRPLYDGRIFQKNNKIVLVMPNLIEDTDYKERLENKCKTLNVEYRFCSNIFANHRHVSESKLKIYSLWDSYTQADLVSYPSLQEGWGNQFLEAVKAKLPIVLFEYDVFKEDIGPFGFKTISLGSNLQKPDVNGLVSVTQDKLHQVAQAVILVLQDQTTRVKMVLSNYEIGLQKFSITALGEYLQPLLSSLSN